VRDLQDARGAPLIDSTDENPAGNVVHSPAAASRPDRRSRTWLAAIAGTVIALDVATKLWVVEVLQDRQVSLLGGYLVLQQHRNPGAAFGFARGSTVVFTMVAVVVIAVILRTSRRLGSVPWGVVLGLLLAGAAGNLVDRLLRSPGVFRGEVIDWINFGPDRFPLFNAADSAIVVGGFCAVLLATRGYELDGSRTSAAAPPPEIAEPVDVTLDNESNGDSRRG